MYASRIDRRNPGCILLMIDRSWSMHRPAGTDTDVTLAQGVADAVNDLLYELVLRCVADASGAPRHYYDIGVIGYGMSAHADREGVEPALGGGLASSWLVSVGDLADSPLRIEERGGGREHDGGTVKRPVWVEPQAGYSTPMCGAIEVAGGVLSDWIARHPDSFPPIVVNITDGTVTDRGSDDAGLYAWADRLKGLSTSDGNVLLFNVFLSPESASATRFFPTSPDGLPQPEGTDLFTISSELPPSMVAMAREVGYQPESGARGMVFNADLTSLVSFLRIGTAIAPGGAHGVAA